ncbi:MAG: hypothetical protein MSG64_20180 [Pyrinomonadaceae bacterium MAG19_C2-C3]|nr:hypothetical protein [Pyrinomonadaceae bacterium MAG19_C2-C3]
MNDERAAKIESKRKALDIARKRSQGAEMLAGWIAALEEACGGAVVPENFLSLEDTQELKSKFFDKVKNKTAYFYRYWSPQELGEVEMLLRVLSFDVDGMQVVLFSEVDQYTGAVILPASRVLANARKVWGVAKGDLALTTSDLQHGLCLEHNFYNESGDYSKEGFYEITAWGALVPGTA